ncbi:tetratricopeptide repeat domain containing protein, putative [Babesia bigemina]|uniref:peptidylprolyl isomerase n=1 Tax=Babesia bigemina TaxID=5866 RepID=A0A061D8H1_BABBI|nr:tetratricopeptide repeat domain containing protein, putative [Babesia bigemina]CDR97006.1 tetratricopeptide repeat domain containing protein, putative [Babesia bigemina]|eukprot:XP_012769192.1 tetratricopeptide repeat domain containing protein, putative [Babesia bigemina]
MSDKSSSSSSSSPASSDIEVDEPVDVQACVAEATSLKEQGNAAFKAADYDTAAEAYQKAVDRLRKLPSDVTEHDGMKSVLYSNLSASYLGMANHEKAISAAEDALRWDPGNKKAQYRRALARFNFGYLDEAKSECQAMIAEDSGNSNARMLLAKIVERQKHLREQQKKAFGGLFNKTGGLYVDRTEEMQQRKQRRFEDFNRERREKGEDELDFEAWERKEEEEEQKREAERIEKVKAEEEKKRNEANGDDKKRNGAQAPEEPKSPTAASAAAKKPKQEESDMDEEDQKIIQETKKMGYCYFGKNKPEGNLTSSRVPQKIETDASSTDTVSRSLSSWNSKGTTYEEKDMSSWCRKAISDSLKAARYENDPSLRDPSVNVMEMLSNINIDKLEDSANLEKLEKLAMMIHKSSIRVTSVADLECDAQIALIRATRRYMFDFSCALKFEASIDTAFGSGYSSDDESKASVYRGTLLLTEISSAMEKGKTYSDYMRVSFEDEPKPEHAELMRCMMDKFKTSVCERIDAFLDAYQQQ